MTSSISLAFPYWHFLDFSCCIMRSCEPIIISLALLAIIFIRSNACSALDLSVLNITTSTGTERWVSMKTRVNLKGLLPLFCYDFLPFTLTGRGRDVEKGHIWVNQTKSIGMAESKWVRIMTWSYLCSSGSRCLLLCGEIADENLLPDGKRENRVQLENTFRH